MRNTTAKSTLQISLRSLLLITLVLGVLGGIYGPKFAEAIREWQKPVPAQPADLPLPREFTVDMGYYESAESPLR